MGAPSTSIRIETADDMTFNNANNCAEVSTFADSGKTEVMCRQPVVARAMQIVNQGSQQILSLCELEIYGGRHVSFNKNTSQDSTLNYDGLNWYSGLAVDGTGALNKSIGLTCSASQNTYGQHWWQVNLGTAYRIEDVYIFTRLDRTDQIAGFRVTNGLHNTYTYTDTVSSNVSDYLPRTLGLTQPIDGDIVRIIRSEILVICELFVYAECMPGWCGLECNDVCMCTNLTTGSLRLNAVCPEGCQGRWTGTSGRCDIECSQTQWGSSCKQTCGNCANNDACDLTNGICPRGCIPSWKPGLCNEQCDDGLWGFGCNQTCGNCTFGGACDKVDGTCPGGCSAGFKPPLCVEECDNGTYGFNCSETCGSCSDRTTCNPVTGICPLDCDPGFAGQLCKDICTDGWFGQNCSMKCGNCQGGGANCHHVTGICSKGCLSGYNSSDTTCKQACNGGWFGQDCSAECGNCKGGGVSCHHETGECFLGCLPGYNHSDVTCIQSCSLGWFGQNCSVECGNCQGGGANCDHVTGVCSDGCLSGYNRIDVRCLQECAKGTYGFNCSETCGNCSEACDHRNGNCPAECNPGFTGQLCKELCDTGSFGKECSETCGACADTACNPIDGNCLAGCIEGYSGAMCRQKIDGPSSRALIGGTVAGVAVIIAVLVALVYRKWRRQKERTSDKVEFAASPPRQTAQQPDFDESGDYVNYEADQIQPEGDRRTIAVSDLRQFVRNISHVQEELVQNYKDIPKTFDLPMLAGRKDNNIPKNKYKDIIPYDFNRVELHGLPGQDDSDYINASLIRSSLVGRSYIASQGPIQRTLPDFWRMIWEESVKVIVMLTNCVELGKVKCAQYWPEKDRVTFGDLEVTLLSERAYNEYTVRGLRCKKVGGEIGRDVTQFHFTAWPDKQVPETALALVNFWRQVRNCDTACPVRWLVHCSAGVGRTGTFIALDALYEKGLRNTYVNVFDYVQELRRQRQVMVQSEGQYVFLHVALTEALVPIGMVYSEEGFNESLAGLTSSSPGQTSQLQIEYEELNSMTEEENPDTQYGNLPYKKDLGTCDQSFLKENRDKSRNEEILPPDEYRPRLGCDMDNRNDYINAVTIPTYRLGGGLILTQVPLPNTAVDFLRLVMTYSIKFVVLLESKVPQNCQYWPKPGDSESKIIGPFTVTQVGETVDHFHTGRALRCSYKDQSIDVTLLHYTGSWKSDVMCPGEHDGFQEFVSDVHSITDPSVSPEPIVIQCLDGNGKSGLFAAFYMIIERIRCTGEVSIAETVLRVRDRRRQAICSVEQYQFLYTATRNYINSSQMYVNLK